MNDASMLERPDLQKRLGLCRRHCHQNLQRKHTTRRPPRNIRGPQQVQNQAQPKKVRVRRPSRKTTRVHGLCPRNRSKPRKGPSNRQDAKANQHQRRATAHRKTRSIEPFHQQARRKDLTVLQTAEKRRKIRVDRGSQQCIHRPEENPLYATNLGGA